MSLRDLTTRSELRGDERSKEESPQEKGASAVYERRPPGGGGVKAGRLYIQKESTQKYNLSPLILRCICTLYIRDLYRTPRPI